MGLRTGFDTTSFIPAGETLPATTAETIGSYCLPGDHTFAMHSGDLGRGKIKCDNHPQVF